MESNNFDIDDSREYLNLLVNRAVSLNDSIEKTRKKIGKLNFTKRIIYILFSFSLVFSILIMLSFYMQEKLDLLTFFDTIKAVAPSITIIIMILSVFSTTLNFIYQNKKTLHLKMKIDVLELNNLLIRIDEFKSYLKTIISEDFDKNRTYFKLLRAINEADYQLRYIKFSHKMG